MGRREETKQDSGGKQRSREGYNERGVKQGNRKKEVKPVGKGRKSKKLEAKRVKEKKKEGKQKIKKVKESKDGRKPRLWREARREKIVKQNRGGKNNNTAEKAKGEATIEKIERGGN